jgi:hypothetical protein
MWDLNFGTWISHRGLHSGLRPRAKFITSVYPSDTTILHFNSPADEARVRHRRTIGPGLAKTGEGLTGCDCGQHGRARHERVPAGIRAFCHGWTETRPLCFRGCRRHRPGYPSSVVSLLSLYSWRREGAGTSRLRLTMSEGHGYPLVIY